MDEKSLIAMMKMYENKLKEYMTEEEYTQFSEQVAKTVFLAEVLASPNDEFKKIVADMIPKDVLDKIRAELHATAEMHDDGDYYLRDEWIDEILDKYKAESEE